VELSLHIDAPLHSAVFYHALAHLPLGDDAASLHDLRYLAAADDARRALGVTKKTPLVRAARRLARLYRRVDDPTPLQVLPLTLAGADACPALLRCLAGEEAPAGAAAIVERARATSAGRELADALRDAIAVELELFFSRWWSAGAAHVVADAPRWREALRDDLTLLVAPLSPALTLELCCCGALRDAGRAWSRDGASVVVATAPPADGDHTRVLFQVLHELTHGATDPLLALDGPPRRTRLDVAGYALHWRLEQAVLAADYHLLRRHRPVLLPAYLDWCQRWILPEAGPSAAARLRRLAESAGVVKSTVAWRSLARVAAHDARRATEAALEELLLVPVDRLTPLERRLVCK
jgi:hypothetical protein